MATIVDGVGTHVANIAVSAWRGVVIASDNGVTYAGTTDIPAGFTQSDEAVSSVVGVKYLFNPTQKCAVTATPVTAGDTLYSGALGRVSTTGTITVGKCLTTTATSGSVVGFIPLR